MQYCRKDIIDFMGVSKGLSHIIKLRKANLGTPKMTKIASTNRHTKEPITQVMSMFHFEPDEVIAHFEAVKEEYTTNPFKHARPLYIKGWDDAISAAKHFKNKKENNE